MPAELTAHAPAKINLVLEVLGRRADGYHEIDTVLQELELAGTVTLSQGRAWQGVRVSGAFAAGTPADTANLAWRAAEALAASVGRTTEGLAITLEKRVPPAGGLGGGASDAATTLRLLQQLWEGVPDAALQAAAAAVGSDEPYFLAGGTARAQGRGEIVTPLPPLERHGVVLFVPPETIEHKTARMFAALGDLPFDKGSIAAAFAEAGTARIESVAVYNAFERVAFDLFPGLAALWEDLEARVQAPVRLAGAGPTLFWIGPPDVANDVAAAARGAACQVIVTATAAPR